MAEIILENIVKRFDKFYAVDNLNLKIDDGSFVTLLGPSGCGKTTTLRMIAGLETPTSGRILLDGEAVFDSEKGINVPANKRNVGFLFQNYALWPNMTVYENIAFGLSNIKKAVKEVDHEYRQAAKLHQAFSQPENLKLIFQESRNKDGKLDQKKAQIMLIDFYEISLNDAKKILSFNLQAEADLSAKAAGLAAEYAEILNKLKAMHKLSGRELNEKFEIIEQGKVKKTVRKLTKEEIDLRVRAVSRIVKIGMFMDRYPNELSGGQQQRVAIARTLAPKPSVLFMDEPLSNLDAKLRLEMRSELQRLHFETESTIIYVTHDQMEAMTLANKICLMENGVLQQYAEPLRIYNHPANIFVADFVGNPSINLVEAAGTENAGKLAMTALTDCKLCFTPNDADFDFTRNLQQRQQIIADRQAELQARQQQRGYVEKANRDRLFRYQIAKITVGPELKESKPATDDDYVLGIRPEAVNIVSTEKQAGTLEAEVYSVMPTGMETTMKLRLGEYLLTAVFFGGVVYPIGSKLYINFKEREIKLFSRKDGTLITGGSLQILA
jgi:hypothetical protein